MGIFPDGVPVHRTVVYTLFERIANIRSIAQFTLSRCSFFGVIGKFVNRESNPQIYKKGTSFGLC